MFYRQLHPDETKWIKDNAKRFAQQQGITEQEADKRLGQQAFRQVQLRVESAEDGQARAFRWSGSGLAFCLAQQSQIENERIDQASDWLDRVGLTNPAGIVQTFIVRKY